MESSGVADGLGDASVPSPPTTFAIGLLLFVFVGADETLSFEVDEGASFASLAMLVEEPLRGVSLSL